MKTQNTKSVKASKKSGNKSKKVVAKMIAPVIENIVETPVRTKNIEVEIMPAPAVVNQVKRGRGRPALSSSQSIVNLADVIAVLPTNSKLVLPNPYLRSLKNLGFRIASSPFKAGPIAISEIAKTYKPVSQSVAVVDLNQETVAA